MSNWNIIALIYDHGGRANTYHHQHLDFHDFGYCPIYISYRNQWRDRRRLHVYKETKRTRSSILKCLFFISDGTFITIMSRILGP
jgi:hypothetical protein